MLLFPDWIAGIQGAPILDVRAGRLVAGTPRHVAHPLRDSWRLPVTKIHFADEL
jgi:hypothetical protein